MHVENEVSAEPSRRERYHAELSIFRARLGNRENRIESEKPECSGTTTTQPMLALDNGRFYSRLTAPREKEGKENSFIFMSSFVT